jgi:serine/threonine protein kinase/tetratricopeptide (TPR) repeat protein
MSADFNRLRDVFLAVVEGHAPEQWPACLDEACGGDEQLRREVAELLKAHSEGATAPARAGGVNSRTTLCKSAGEAPSAVIGPYKLLEPIGEGGMGAVWMAEQLEPVRRKVALKLIKPGMDTKQVLARFEAERQALALMDHPNIAKVLDAATGPGGRPYFVMELVKGIPITRYCDERHLPLRARLGLFVAVCQAVQHAHTKGVIHRDLKPSNVLIALYDGIPVPKVIDFGIAKGVGPRLTERTLFTEFGTIVGTLEYMSPEQAELNQLDVDTRSDVYSLGVLLYELLTGTTPLERRRLRESPLLEALRLIREEEAPRPSARLTTVADLATVAANRGVEPARISGLLRGELDWIVLKCLEKDRSRRYETASALAMDLQRHLADEPVLACPPSAGYRLRKLARRYRGAALASATILVILSGGIIGTTAGLIQANQARGLEAEQRRIAEQERDEKERAREEAVAHLQTARRAMERMLASISRDGVAFEPRLEGVWRDLLQETMTFYRELHDARGDDVTLRKELALAHSRLGRAYQRVGERAKALQSLRLSVDMLEQLARENLLTPDSRQELIGAYHHLGWVLSESGRRDERVAAHERAFRHAEQLVADSPAVRQHRDRLADACTILGCSWRPARPRDAEALFRRAIDLAGAPGGNRHYSGTAHLALGELLADEGRFPEAEAALSRSIALFKEIVEGSPRFWQGWDRLGNARLYLGRVLAITGRSADAEHAFREAVGVGEKQTAAFPLVPGYREDLIAGYAELARLLAAVGKADEARSVLQKLARMIPEGAAACSALAWLLATCAEPSFRDPAWAVTLAQKAVDLTPQFARNWRALGAARYRAGDPEGARAALVKSMEIRKGGDGYDWFLLAMAHGRLGNTNDARLWYERAVEWMDKHQPKNSELVRFRAEAGEVLKPQP